MPDTMHVPVIGTHKKSTVVLLAGAAVGGGYLLYKHYTKPATSAGTSAYGYGGGYGSYGGAYAYGYGMSDPYGQWGFGGGGGYPWPLPPTPTPSPGPTTPTTNAQWTQAVLPQLKAAGFNEMSALTALGKYLTGRSLTNDQEHVVEAAIGFEGYPPQAGPSGYPPNIKRSARTGHKGHKHNRPCSNTMIADGQEDLHRIARDHGLSESALVVCNPSLARYVGTGKHIPRGTKVKY